MVARCFYVDTRTGDATERRLLIQTGYQSMIAVGGTDGEGVGWLLEIYGDSLTGNLHEFTCILQQLAEHALG